ncbi:hypothetical protein hrd7_22690 [Leptolinea sp. HRD-7]|nr:hypothetical protein hrd7_22690 [Leptolinea sp. HRD-7]
MQGIGIEVFVGVMGIGVDVDVIVFEGVTGGIVAVSVGDGSTVTVDVGGGSVLVGGPDVSVASVPV